jgi:RecA/RadA recombinase
VKIIPTGIKEIDEKLIGLTAGLTMIYGRANTDKLELALRLCINGINQGFSILMLTSRPHLMIYKLDQMNATIDRSKIYFIQIRNIKEQTYVTLMIYNGEINYDFIVIDSIGEYYRISTDLYSPLLLWRLAIENMMLLNHAARKFNIPILVIMPIRRNPKTGNEEPVMGNAVIFWSDTIIHLRKINGKKYAVIERLRGEQVNYEIIYE